MDSCHYIIHKQSCCPTRINPWKQRCELWHLFQKTWLNRPTRMRLAAFVKYTFFVFFSFFFRFRLSPSLVLVLFCRAANRYYASIGDKNEIITLCKACRDLFSNGHGLLNSFRQLSGKFEKRCLLVLAFNPWVNVLFYQYRFPRFQKRNRLIRLISPKHRCLRDEAN